MKKKFSVTSLSASSNGNSYHLKCGDAEFLIDVGISAKKICDSLNSIGSDISKINAIFITHEHIDHVKGLAVLSKKYNIPVHMTGMSAEEYLKCNPEVCNITFHTIVYECNVCGINVKSFPSSHDSSACVGYTFETEDDKFGIATDMGCVGKEAVTSLMHCNSVVIESNYDENRLANGTHPENLKCRIRSAKGHLSNYDCAALARFLAEHGTKNFMLGHLSEENNTPEIAMNVTSRALAGFDDIVLKVASSREVTYFI